MADVVFLALVVGSFVVVVAYVRACGALIGVQDRIELVDHGREATEVST